MNTSATRNLTAEILDAQQPFDVAVDSRKQAWEQFRQLELPTGKNEEYRFTPVTRYLEKNFTWKTDNPESTLSSVQECLIPQLDANVIVLVNGRYNASLSKISSPQSEVTITPLSEAFRTGHPAIKEHYNKHLNNQSDACAALNSAAWQEGVFIYVGKNTVVGKPIFILQLNDASQSQVITQTRVFAVLEKDSSVAVIEKSDTTGNQFAFHNFAEEWIVSEGAHLEYCKIQNDAGKVCQVSNSVIYQANNSKLNTFTLTLNGQLIRNNLNILIDGENCESHFYGLYLLTGTTHADNHTVVDHRKPNSFSNEMYKGIMDGNSKGVFNGKIYVRPHAQKTNAFQSNRNIIVSDSATINTKPQLEIWADDVKCSHGCTSGQLDEEALFYLRSRGISETNAKAMLLYAFAAEVLAPIQNETLKVYLDNLIAERLHKNF
ncbi:MAG: FeS assembly protein SufD [Bacteroidetes bacterium OLB12]|nr:MAG: FeS assembly protein SufD [Bacteroidetes bacterium OLB12]HNR73766.1 Fe-S cluster assembly protein SufD [Cyclobacteriaceae bacterium]HNU43051.1 Fe-S cluster assembly protein SufD [Cyclobacteriaceae bacterium]